MSDLSGAMALLQLGDSFFPSGAASFSWGLETLRAEGHLARAGDVEAFLAGQIRLRWATFDRPVVLASHRAHGDLEVVAAVDREADAATLAREAREGGRRIGAALLRVHAGLGTPGAASYRDRVASGHAPGQLAAVQGLAGFGCGLSESATCALSAYGVGVAIVSAALRVGLLGHLDGQRILSRCRPLAVEVAAGPPAGIESLHAYTPMAEIAMMRHEVGTGRLFAN
ncbi:MAG: urease accessory protein UreF [Betaproteobacteria bacterium]|nr:urease accessory protein UreF [Betaproteobacteria bacterium]